MAYSDAVLFVDPEGWRVTVNAVPVELTPSEFRLLCRLVEKPGAVVPTSALAEALWGAERAGTSISTLRVHLTNLRTKLSAAAGGQPLVLSIRAMGYRYEPQARLAADSTVYLNTTRSSQGQVFGSSRDSRADLQSDVRLHLTPREKAVLELLLAGLSDKEIARELRITTDAVRRHEKNLREKHDARSRTHLAIRALQMQTLGDLGV